MISQPEDINIAIEREKANNLALTVGRDFNLADYSNSYNDVYLNLAGFALRKLRVTFSNLHPHPGSFYDFLDYNDIPFRVVKRPPRLVTKERVLLVITTYEGDMYLLFREGRKYFVFDPKDNSLSRFSDEIPNLTEDVIEIYPSMPIHINSAWDVLGFSFGNELTAIFSLIVASAFVMLFNLSIPMLTNTLVAQVLPMQQSSLLVSSLFIVLLIIVGSIVSQYLQQLMLLRLETVTDLRLQTAVWDRLLRLPVIFFSSYTTGDLASRVNAISDLRQLLGSGAISTVISALFASSYFVLMYRYDFSLANYALAITILGLACVAYLTRQQVRLQFPLQENEAEVTNFALQSLVGSAQIRSTGSEPFLFVQWMARIQRYVRTKLFSNLYNDSMQIYSLIIIPISTTIVFGVAAFDLVYGGVSDKELSSIVAPIVAFNAAYSAFNSKLNEAVIQISTIAAQAVVLWKRATPILYSSVESGYRPEAIRANVSGNYLFSDVLFRYPDAPDNLFRNLSFDIPSGQHTALVGQSGCGKTTIFRLMLGFLTPVSGAIYVDGIPLEKLAIRSYRKQIGIVLQDSRLSSGSIYDAITCGIPYSEDEVWAALESAQIADEIHAMPMKLDTVISQGSSNISGGQRQRVAIARALIKQPKILLMDEATSALDNSKQELITNHVQKLGITRVTIAHRMSTIREAHNIIKIVGKSAHYTNVDQLISEASDDFLA